MWNNFLAEIVKYLPSVDVKWNKSPNAPQCISHAERISRTQCISQIPQGIYFVEKSTHCLGRQMCAFFWRRRRDLNSTPMWRKCALRPWGYAQRSFGNEPPRSKRRQAAWWASSPIRLALLICAATRIASDGARGNKAPLPENKKDTRVGILFVCERTVKRCMVSICCLPDKLEFICQLYVLFDYFTSTKESVESRYGITNSYSI